MHGFATASLRKSRHCSRCSRVSSRTVVRSPSASGEAEELELAPDAAAMAPMQHSTDAAHEGAKLPCSPSSGTKTRSSGEPVVLW